jgi:hypothetical protein
MAAGMAASGHLRAFRADHEQAIDTLKAAFVQGRLTKDELDERVGQTFAARTYAELAVVTADIPGRQASRPGSPSRDPQPSARRCRAGRRELVPVLIVVVVMTVAGAVLSTVGGRLLWRAAAPIWLLAVPGALTGNMVGQFMLIRYYLDTFVLRQDGGNPWWLLVPGVSVLLFLAVCFLLHALTRAIGGPGAEPVMAALTGVVIIAAVVRYWLPLGVPPDRDAR